MYFGFDYINIILEKASIRVGINTVPLLTKVSRALLLSLKNLIPFTLIKSGLIIVLILIILSIYFLILNYKKYFPLLLIIIIPIVRYILLSSHSISFHYFTYRAFAPLILLISVILLSKIGDCLNKFN